MGTMYSEKLTNPKWQKKRLRILERDNWTCTLCGDKETTLHVHHNEYSVGEPWDVDDSALTTHCEHCHVVVEALKKNKEFRFSKSVRVVIKLFPVATDDDTVLLIAVSVRKAPGDPNEGYYFFEYYSGSKFLKYLHYLPKHILDVLNDQLFKWDTLHG